MDHIDISSNIVKQYRLDESPLVQSRNTGNGLGEVADLQALKKVCQDFESIFVYTLLKSMRQTIPKPEGAGTSREIYTSIGDFELARSVARGRGIGLGDLLFEQLKEKVR